MKAKPALFQRAGKAFKKATPTILTCISAAGVVVTVVLAVKATPKALKCIEKEKEVKNAENGENLTRMETIAACWRCYIPAAATGIATIGCIFGANALNRRQQASLVSAYALASRSFNSYKQKDFFENNPVITLWMDGEKYEYEIFAAHVVLADINFIRTKFKSEEEFVDYFKEFKSYSKFQNNVEVEAGDQVLTLSTCTYEYYDSRFVVQAVRKQ